MMYDHMTDEQLAEMGTQDAELVLTRRYWEKAYYVSGEFVIPGMDRDDRHAVALRGFVKGMRKWQPGQGSKFRTFVKLAMRRALIDAWRQAHESSEIPRTKILALEERTGGDETGVTLAETIASDEQVEAGVLDRMEAVETMNAVIAAQQEEAEGMFQSLSAGGDAALVKALRIFAGCEVSRGRLEFTTFANLVSLTESDSDKTPSLFAPAIGTPEATAIASDLLVSYWRLQLEVLADLAVGYTALEIAGRHEVEVDVVGGMIRALRSVARRGEAA